MFVSKDIVFTELHKTGGTHICRWLHEIVGGQQIGKHNRIPAEYWGKFIIGSVRNPWDWYVSLWAYGCGGLGSVYSRTTNKIDFQYINCQLHGEMGIRRLNSKQWARQTINDLFKPVSSWKKTYHNSSDSVAFRDWLKMIMDPDRRFDMGEGYGFSPVSKNFGLLTYRYLKLFTKLGDSLYHDQSLNNLEVVRNAISNLKIVDYVVRKEFLEQDLLEALRISGCNVSFVHVNSFLSAKNDKTNSSKRLQTENYYDQDTIDLVYKREINIIEAYDYMPPA